MLPDVEPVDTNFTDVNVGNPNQFPGNSQLTIGLQFYNSSGQDLIVVTRQGAEFIIPHLGQYPYKGLQIVKEYQVGSEVAIDTTHMLDDPGETPTVDIIAEEAALHRNPNRTFTGFNTSQHKVDYKISKADLSRCGGSLYFPALDLTIYIKGRVKRTVHPYSVRGSRAAIARNTFGLQYDKGIHFQVRIIDNEGTFGPRFINLGGKVFRVNPEIDRSTLSGVYVANTPSINSEAEQPAKDREVKHYFFSNVSEDLHLYTTYVDALTLGNPETILKEKSEQRKAALAEMDYARAQAQREVERERDELRVRLQQMQDEASERELRNKSVQHEQELQELVAKRTVAEVKEKYQIASYDRQESVEVLKYVPALVVGVGAIVLTIMKLKGK